MRNISNDSFYFRILYKGTFFNVNEPVGWNQVIKTLEEDPDYYGLNYEYINSKLVLLFTFQSINDGGFLLRDLYDEFGNDAKADFEFGEIMNGQVTRDFVGTFNFNEYEANEDGVRISIEKVSFESLFRTRYDIKVPLNADRTLDGDPVDPLDPKLILLHSKRIAKTAEASLEEPINWDDAAALDPVAFLQFDSTNLTSVELKQIFALPLAIGGDPVADSRFNFEAEEAGFFEVNFKGSIEKILVDITALSTTIPADVTITIFPFVKVERDSSLITDNQIGLDIVYDQEFTGILEATVALEDINFNVHYSIDLIPEDRVYFGLRLLLGGDPASGLITEIENYTNQISVLQLTEAEQSTAFGYNWFDALNRVIYLTTGINNALVSPFFDVGGCGHDYLVINGFSIRGFSIDERPLFASARDLIEGMMPLFNAGILITEDDGPKILVQRFNSFYGNQKLLSLNQAESLVFMANKDFIFNEVEVTYAAFEDEQPNTLDQFATLRQYLMPIKTFKAKKEIKSAFIISSYSIEYQRRAQFLENPSESLEHDDAIFLIHYSIDRTYKDLKMKTVESTKKLFTDRRLAYEAGRQFRFSDDAEFYAFAEGEDVTDEPGYNWEYNLITGAPDRTITNTGSEFVDLIIYWDPDVDGLQAVRDEEFTIVENLVDRFTEYNLRLSPGRVLNNWADYLNICIEKKNDQEIIIPTFARNNRLLSTTFARQANCIINEKNTISEDDDIELSEFGLNRFKPFKPMIIQFSSRVPFSKQKDLFQKLRKFNNVNGPDPGFIELIGANNKTYLLYVSKAEYHIKREELKITGHLINSVN